MHQESKTNNKNGIRRWPGPFTPGKIIFLVILGLLTIYLIFLLIVPGVQVSRLDQQYGMQQDEGVPLSEISDHSGIFDLQKKKIFFESRLKMVRSDSIGLTVNLPDSLVTLEINGIMLHKTRINSYHVSKVFSAVSQQTYLGMFADPLRITSHYATMEKVPLIYRKAPKDSIEAAEQLSELPDTTLRKPPLMVLSTDHNILLFFCPYEDIPFSDKLVKLLFNTLQQLKLHGHYLSSVVRLKMPAYHPGMKICIPEREIISLYRALPENAMITIMF